MSKLKSRMTVLDFFGSHFVTMQEQNLLETLMAGMRSFIQQDNVQSRIYVGTDREQLHLRKPKVQKFTFNTKVFSF